MLICHKIELQRSFVTLETSNSTEILSQHGQNVFKAISRNGDSNIYNSMTTEIHLLMNIMRWLKPHKQLLKGRNLKTQRFYTLLKEYANNLALHYYKIAKLSGMLSYLHYINTGLALPIMQIDHCQFSLIVWCVMLLPADVASSFVDEELTSF